MLFPKPFAWQGFRLFQPTRLRLRHISWRLFQSTVPTDGWQQNLCVLRVNIRPWPLLSGLPAEVCGLSRPHPARGSLTCMSCCTGLRAHDYPLSWQRSTARWHLDGISGWTRQTVCPSGIRAGFSSIVKTARRSLIQPCWPTVLQRRSTCRSW